MTMPTATATGTTIYSLPFEIIRIIVDMVLPQSLWLEVIPAHSLYMARKRRRLALFNQAARFTPVLDRGECKKGPVVDLDWRDRWEMFWEYNETYADTLYQQALGDWYHAIPTISTNRAITALSLTNRAMRLAVVSVMVAREIPVTVLGPGSPAIDTLVPLARDVARRSPTLILRYSWLESDRVGLERLINDMPRLQTVLLPGLKIEMNVSRAELDIQHLYDGLILRRRSAYDLVVDLLAPLMPANLYRKQGAASTTIFREVIIQYAQRTVRETDSDSSDNTTSRLKGLGVVLGYRLARQGDADSLIFIAQFRGFESDNTDLYHWRTMQDYVVPEFRRQFGDQINSDVEFTYEDPDHKLGATGNSYDVWYSARPSRQSDVPLVIDTVTRVRYMTTALDFGDELSDIGELSV